MKTYLQKHFDEVISTIKMVEVEEKFDIYFSRFFGLYFAKFARFLNLTPTHVSLISLVFGIAGGVFLYFQEDIVLVSVGGLFIILAGVLDSADGQLARLTGQSSDLGRIIDGVIDNFVFGACYFGAVFYFFSEYGWWIFLLGGAAGYAQSFKGAIYEFYKSEFIFLVGRIRAGYIPLDLVELKPKGTRWYQRALEASYLDYTRKQLFYTTRTRKDRELMQQLSEVETNGFRRRYAKLNKKLLFWWSLVCGSNVHRNAIVICSLFGRFDVYLWASLFWTIGTWPLSLIQRKSDEKILSS